MTSAACSSSDTFDGGSAYVPCWPDSTVRHRSDSSSSSNSSPSVVDRCAITTGPGPAPVSSWSMAAITSRYTSMPTASSGNASTSRSRNASMPRGTANRVPSSNTNVSNPSGSISRNTRSIPSGSRTDGMPPPGPQSPM
jgi:hypothetical protein